MTSPSSMWVSCELSKARTFSKSAGTMSPAHSLEGMPRKISRWCLSRRAGRWGWSKWQNSQSLPFEHGLIAPDRHGRLHNSGCPALPGLHQNFSRFAEATSDAAVFSGAAPTTPLGRMEVAKVGLERTFSSAELHVVTDKRLVACCNIIPAVHLAGCVPLKSGHFLREAVEVRHIRILGQTAQLLRTPFRRGTSHARNVSTSFPDVEEGAAHAQLQQRRSNRRRHAVTYQRKGARRQRRKLEKKTASRS
mmetsp:Transcript_117168/g.373205  ORF Transcript_117168/g.373205 Transcript_117168/m.373205 type:complete len:249 (+) Transcript_117168:624-1370(+)